MADIQNNNWIPVLFTILVAGGFIGANTILPDIPVYSCEKDPGFIVTCDGFSKYVSPVGKCINATDLQGVKQGNKICRTGWRVVEDDRPPIVNDDNVSILDENTVVLPIHISLDDIYAHGYDDIRVVYDNDNYAIITMNKKELLE